MISIDDLLGPALYHVIDDGEGGQWEISLRPRESGAFIVRTTMVSFHRPNYRTSSGFAVQVRILRMVATWSEELKDPIVESAINLTRESAKNAIAWVDTLERGKL